MFFVTLFVNNRVYQFKIDELIQKLDKGFLVSRFGAERKKIYFPIIIKGDTYCLGKRSQVYDIRCNDQPAAEGRELAHGDYFWVIADKFNYSVLITSCQKLSTSSVLYRLKSTPVFVGRDAGSDIVLDINGNVSRKCAAIRCDEENHYFVEDVSGKTGIYVNEHREVSKKLSDGDEIFIMGTAMLFYQGKLVIPAGIQTKLEPVGDMDMVEPAEEDPADYYVRTPRIMKTEEQGKIVIDPPPAPQMMKDMPFLLAVGPSMTMSLAMLASLGVTISNVLGGNGSKASLITSGVMAASMLAGALLWPTLLRRYNKKQEIKNEAFRQERYTAYLAEKENEIRQKYERSTRILNENRFPHPDKLLSMIAEQDRRLWERGPKDEDFLTVRLGAGERMFRVDIQSPHKGFILNDDPMLDNAIALKQKYSTLTNVPVSFSLLEKRIVGVVGATMDMLKIFVTNIIATHSFDEVKLVFVYDAADLRKLQWLNDLPHVWSNDKKQRYIATDKNEAKTLFSNLEELITEREERLQQTDRRLPHFVIFIMDERLIEDVSFCRYMLNAEKNVGISTLFFGKRFSSIPKECVAIIQKDDTISGVYVKNENDNRFIQFKADVVSDADVRKAARDINRIQVKRESGHSGVPDRVTFLDMYKVGNVDSLEIMNHWKTNISEKSLAAPIGIKSDGEVFSLDIHEKYHGCHGLVAGTTGSGKSEFLQEYILSMMVNYSPNEVAFVLVDFKGGDMARPFLKSPHLAATISNLSGNTLHRALLSLEAEVKSRQNTFNRAAEALGVDKIDINSYQKLFKDKKLSKPLPHLIIVIDEFAQLKAQHPEFMSKLVDIAQVGRSLGIHLILATQRPSGVVDPQIWSNSKFKVCLKVLDKQDSMDMINHPEAALIKQPGRAYVQVGYDEIFEQVQTGYSGADYVEQADYIDEESILLSMVNWPAEKIRVAKKSLMEKRSSKTQLEEVVAALANIGAAAELGVKQLWLPPLPHKLSLEKCAQLDTFFQANGWDTEVYGSVVCGMADLPERQEQLPFGIDFLKDGHLAIYGSSSSGKSTLINTLLFALALQYSPEMLNVFVMDFDGSSLSGLASMPHCAMYADGGDEQSVRVLLKLIQSVIQQRQKLFADNHCANYESYISQPGCGLPMVLLVLDNYAAFREKMYRMEDLLLPIIAAAKSCGVYFIVTGNSKGAVYYKVTEHISNKIVLNMNDSGAYRDILNVPIPIMPELTKGRALALMDKKAVEVQFAVPFDVENEAVRMRKIHGIYEQMYKLCGGVSYEVPMEDLDEDVDIQQIPMLVHTPAPLLPMEDIQDAGYSLVFGSDIRTGRAKGFAMEGGTVVFVGRNGDEHETAGLVKQLASGYAGKLYLISQQDLVLPEENVELVADLDTFIPEMILANDPQTTLIINGFCDFYDRISDEALMLLERALSKNLLTNIVTLDPMARIGEYRDTGLYVHLVRTNKGLIAGGDIQDALAAELNTCLYEIPNQHRQKKLQKGQAAIYCGNKMSYIHLKGGTGNG